MSPPSQGVQSSPIPIALSPQDEDLQDQRKSTREQGPEIPSPSPLVPSSSSSPSPPSSLSSSEPPFVLDLSSSSGLASLPIQDIIKDEEGQKEEKKEKKKKEEEGQIKELKAPDEVEKKETKILEDKKILDLASSPKDLAPISVSPISSGGSSLKQRTMQMENQRNEAEKERKRKAEQQRREAEKRSGQVAGGSDPKKFLNSLPKEPSAGAKDEKAPKTLEEVVDTLGAFGIHFLGLFVCLLILPGSALLHWRDLFTSTFLLASFDLSLFFPLMSLLHPIFVMLLDKFAKQHVRLFDLSFFFFLII